MEPHLHTEVSALYAEIMAVRACEKQAWDCNVKGSDLWNKKRDYIGALKCYDKGIQLNPTNCRTLGHLWNGKSWALYWLGRFYEALDSYNKALQVNPQDRGIYEGQRKRGESDFFIKCQVQQPAPPPVGNLELIRDNRSVKTLNLANNDLSTNIDTLCDVLTVRTDLVSISLANCHLDEVALRRLLNILSNNRVVAEINISGNAVSPELLGQFQALIDINTDATTIDLGEFLRQRNITSVAGISSVLGLFALPLSARGPAVVGDGAAAAAEARYVL